MRKLFYLFLFNIITLTSFSATYTTISDGAWNDGSIWSLDGVTSCSCIPSDPIVGDTIIVNHDVTTTNNIVVNGNSVFTINSSGSLLGSYRFNINNSTMFIYGDISGTRFIVDNGSTVEVEECTMTFSSRFYITNGTITFKSAFLEMTGGNILVESNGVLSVNNSKINGAGGSLENSGVININVSSCITVKGTWENTATGVVNGDGTVISTNGNLQNYNTWSGDIVWCAFGSSDGMVSPEDCALSNTNCDGIVLPITLIEFDGYDDVDVNQLYWTTSSEINNRHFVIERSENGIYWDSIGLVNGSGNSNYVIHYEYTDTDPFISYTYYRLKQVDFNGNYEYSKSIAVENHSTIFYTFTKDGDYKTLYFSEVCEYELYSLIGLIHVGKDDHIDTHGLTSGLYLLKIDGYTQKIFVR